jgi:hypothetical protein
VNNRLGQLTTEQKNILKDNKRDAEDSKCNEVSSVQRTNDRVDQFASRTTITTTADGADQMAGLIQHRKCTATIKSTGKVATGGTPV